MRSVKRIGNKKTFFQNPVHLIKIKSLKEFEDLSKTEIKVWNVQSGSDSVYNKDIKFYWK